MPRPKLGSDATEGQTAKMEVRVPAALRDAAAEMLQEKETLSAFVREAMEREVKRRSASVRSSIPTNSDRSKLFSSK